jgi:hypothetical protein
MPLRETGFGSMEASSHSAAKAHQAGTPMNPYVGTSGYSYKEWKGTFYPRKLPATQMLPFYSAHFRTVEINYTFKRLPTALILEEWADAVPAADPKPTRRRCCSARHRAS